MSHTFTHEERQKGGWGRARQHADWRRVNPSPAEARTQKALLEMGWDILPEFEIATSLFPQWIDIYATKDGREVAIEVDGSHGWHNQDGYHNKMAIYDETKAKWCAEHGIELIYVPGRVKIKEYLEKMLDKERIKENGKS